MAKDSGIHWNSFSWDEVEPTKCRMKTVHIISWGSGYQGYRLKSLLVVSHGTGHTKCLTILSNSFVLFFPAFQHSEDHS